MRHHVRRSARLAALGVGLALPLAFSAYAFADGASDFGAAIVTVDGTTLKLAPPLSPNSFMSARILQDPVGLGSAQPRLVVQANQFGRPVVEQAASCVGVTADPPAVECASTGITRITVTGSANADVLSLGSVGNTQFPFTVLSVVSGGAGNDTYSGSAAGDSLTGDAGADSLFGNDGSDTLTGGTGADLLNGGPGNDVLSAIDAEKDRSLVCGPGTDLIFLDLLDPAVGSDCETVLRAPINVKPNVSIVGDGVRVAGRSLLVPLTCPAVRSEGCIGTLSATRLHGGALGDEVGYRVRKGSRRTIAISLSPSQASAVEAGRTVRITSRETTLDGRPRTTSFVTSLS